MQSNAGRHVLDPGGVTAISPGSRFAHPGFSDAQCLTTPAGVAAARNRCDPSGVVNHIDVDCRWYRCAQPPANCCHPSGVKSKRRNSTKPIASATIVAFILFLVSSFIIPPSSLSAADGWSAVESEVYAAIGRGELPGAVIAVLYKDEVVYRKAFGSRVKLPAAEPMTVDTIFDLASITKPVATATSIWSLIEAGKLKLDEKVVAYWPEFAPQGKDQLTLAHLLLHTSGLIADNPLGDYADVRSRRAGGRALAIPSAKSLFVTSGRRPRVTR